MTSAGEDLNYFYEKVFIFRSHIWWSPFLVPLNISQCIYVHCMCRSSMKISWVWEFKINVTFFSGLSLFLSTFWLLPDFRQKNMFKLTFPIVNTYRQANPHQIGKCFMEENYFLWHNLPSWQPGFIKRFFIKYIKKKNSKSFTIKY